MAEKNGIEKLRDLINDIDIAMLTTVEADGSLRSRPMSTQQTEFDGDLWFFTLADTPKVDDIRRERHINVSYAKPDESRYVSVSGVAQLVRDPQKMKELWNPLYKAYFPEGLNDPNLALLKVSVEQAEYWDDSSSKMVQLFRMVKAVVTGAEYNAENEKIKLT